MDDGNIADVGKSIEDLTVIDDCEEIEKLCKDIDGVRCRLIKKFGSQD